LKSKKPVSGFRLLSWYAYGPVACPSSEFIGKSRVWCAYMDRGMGQRSHYSSLIKVFNRLLILGRVDENSD
jgi:hypothetical protein